MTQFQIVHFMPGRLRVRMDQVRTDPAFGTQLEQALRLAPGIEAVTVRPLTGSVLVEYDPAQVDIEGLLSLGRMLGVIPPDLPPLPGTPGESGPSASPWDIIGATLGSAVETGGRLAGKALQPQVALGTVALSALARQAGAAGLALSPGVAAAWIVASLLLGPEKPKGKSGGS